MLLPTLAVPESAQAVYDRLQARLSSVAWVEFTDDSVAETNFWTEYRVERPRAVASIHHTVFSVFRSDGIRTTDSETRRNRPARPGDVWVPPGWEALVGRHGEPMGNARDTAQGTEIDLVLGTQNYVLRIDPGTGLPAGYRIVQESSDLRDRLDFRYGGIQIHGTRPEEPICVATPESIERVVGPFAVWLRRRSHVRLRLTQDIVGGGGWKDVHLHKRPDVRPKTIVPGFEPLFGVEVPKPQGVGIRWLDAVREGYVARTYGKHGWTDVYYSTSPIGRIRFPVGYVRVVDGSERERVAVEVEG